MTPLVSIIRHPIATCREHFIAAEGVLASGFAAAFAAWIEVSGRWELLEALLHENRGGVYGTLASVFGALLGFVITTLAIVLSFSDHTRLQMLKETRHYRTLWKVFTTATWTLALSTIAPVVALLADREKHPLRWPAYLVIWGSLLGIARVYRCVWVIERIVTIVTGPHGEEDE
jgi:hypothetical protein